MLDSPAGAYTEGRAFVIASTDAAAAAMQRDIALATRSAGADLVGGVTRPSGSRDFTPDLLAVSNKGAQVIVLALVGRDLADAVQQAGLARSHLGRDCRRSTRTPR